MTPTPTRLNETALYEHAARRVQWISFGPSATSIRQPSPVSSASWTPAGRSAKTSNLTAMYSAIHIPTGETIQRGMTYRETEIARVTCIWIDEIEFLDEIIKTN